MTAAACGSADPIAAEDPVEGTGVAASDEARADPSASAADVASAIEGNRAFAVDAYLQLAAAGRDNLVLSPASIRLALAMAWAGAEGVTAEQMAEVLHLDLPAEEMHAALNAVDTLLAARNREEPPGPDDRERKVVLTISNALWGQAGFEFLETFLDTLAVSYGAGMRLVDFVVATEEARATINDWVSDQTNERIPELIPAGVLSELTRLVITNAVYLDASWMTMFDPAETRDGSFTTLEGEEVTAEVMHQTHGFLYSAGPGWQAVELPYVGNELAMLLIVPDAGSFGEVEADLGAVLAGAVAGLSMTDVALGLPTWEFRTQASLVEMLASLGMTDAFDQARADFSAMTGEPDLFISDVLHEAFISVDEDGTEAAAATAVIMDLRAAMPGDTVDLEIDRPFLFSLYDRESGEVLFIGRVADPTV
jgi:serpin B